MIVYVTNNKEPWINSKVQFVGELYLYVNKCFFSVFCRRASFVECSYLFINVGFASKQGWICKCVLWVKIIMNFKQRCQLPSTFRSSVAISMLCNYCDAWLIYVVWGQIYIYIYINQQGCIYLIEGNNTYF